MCHSLLYTMISSFAIMLNILIQAFNIVHLHTDGHGFYSFLKCSSSKYSYRLKVICGMLLWIQEPAPQCVARPSSNNILEWCKLNSHLLLTIMLIQVLSQISCLLYISLLKISPNIQYMYICCMIISSSMCHTWNVGVMAFLACTDRFIFGISRSLCVFSAYV